MKTPKLPAIPVQPTAPTRADARNFNSSYGKSPLIGRQQDIFTSGQGLRPNKATKKRSLIGGDANALIS